MAGRGARAGGEPQDVIMIRQLLDSMGVEEYEPRVVQQLLDFMYRYVSDVLQDAEGYLNWHGEGCSYCGGHAGCHVTASKSQGYGERAGMGKGAVDVEDILTAIQSRAAFSFVQPPSQDILASLAVRRNAQPLPEIGKAHGLRLPPEDACLTAPTWALPRPKPPGQPSGSSAGTAGAPPSGATAMEVDGGAGSSGAYPWRQQPAGSGARPLPNANPGEAPDE